MREALSNELKAMEDTLGKLIKSSDAHLARLQSLTQTLMRLAAQHKDEGEDGILDADLED
jgi:hypothetical protein